jgi:hypothetical protein
MTSLLTSVKTTSSDTEYFIPVGDLTGRIFALNTTNGALSLSTATWAFWGAGAPGAGTSGNRALSSINAAGAGILRDMGKTVVSSLRTFRRVQLVLTGAQGSNSTLSTFGVGGRAGTAGEDYLTGYIEMGFEGNGVPAPVAHFGR